MLISLRLENIALFGSQEIEFDNGFTVFTGQTGTGKSIFINAINILLSPTQKSSDKKIIKSGSSFSSIEGVFSILPSIKNWLFNQEIDIDDDLIVTREWRLKDNKYKSRFRVNGSIVNREQIASLRCLLLDFTLQGDAYLLRDSHRQIDLLDSLASKEIKQIISNVKDAWIVWNNSFIELNNYQEKIDNFKIEFKEMKYILDDLEKLKLSDPLEDINLEKEQNRLSNLFRLQEGVNSIMYRLNEGLDEHPSLLDHISFCVNELKTISKLDSSLESILEMILKLNSSFDDFVFLLKEYQSTLDIDPSYLNDLQYRLSLLKISQRKYQRNLPELIKYQEQLKNDLLINQNLDNLENLVTLEKDSMTVRDNFNSQLSNARKHVASQFESKLIKYLDELGMPNVRFKVSFETCEPTSKGIDKVEFMFSANPGLALAPLAEIASGGEKSRVLLAIKSIFSTVDGTNLLVFDEIDSGVSGSTSACIAKLLNKLSRYRQVFCVTHQPLIAANADNHFSFTKTVESDKTSSYLKKLDKIEDRKLELASLAGGELIEAMAYAASLLEHKAA